MGQPWDEPEGAVVLDVGMPSDAPIGIYVIEHVLRSREVLGEETYSRPSHLAPNVVWISDRAMFRYSFADPRHPSQPAAARDRARQG